MSPVAQAKVAALMIACGAGVAPLPTTGWSILKHPFAYLETVTSGVDVAAAPKPSVPAKAPAAEPGAPKSKPTVTLSSSSPLPQRQYFNVMANDTEVGQVLQAISARTGASIVYAGKPGTTVSINVRVDSAESAIRSVVAAAGLAYRRVGNTFIVAPEANMRQALAPYGGRATIQVPESIAPKAVAAIQESLPYLTVRALGDRMTLVGIQEDIEEARDYIAHLSSQQGGIQTVDEAVTVNKASAAELVKAAAALYPDVKAVTTSTQAVGGAIALSGPATSVQRVKELITRLDVGTSPSDDPDFETRVVDLKYTSARALSEFLKKAAPDVEAVSGPETPGPSRPHFSPLSSTLGGSSNGGGVGGGNLGAGTNGAGGSLNNEEENTSTSTQPGAEGVGRRSDRSRTVILRGTHSAIEKAMALISRIDVKPKQVMVEVRVVETSKTFADNIGLQYNFGTFHAVESAPGSQVPAFPVGSSALQPTRPGGFGTFSRVPWDVMATLNAQIREGQAKLLASPSVQVLDNEDANIFIGDTIRARIAQATGFGAQTVDIREFPIGIVLLLKPRVASDGSITMHVNPVVSSITSVGADNIPQTSSREAETTVMVRDGETIVIGGLIRDDMTREITRVPLLSQIPILGELFKNHTTNKTKSEIVVTITPHIMRDDPETPKP